MSEASAYNGVKTCRNCTYRKSPVCLSVKLVQACARISQNPDEVNVAALTTLIKEAEALRRRKYKCGKEANAWIHIMDRACAFWQPSGQVFLC